MDSGQLGESNAPVACTECDQLWTAVERLHTGDEKGIGGWEDWVYCAHCKFDRFYPVVKAAEKE